MAYAGTMAETSFQPGIEGFKPAMLATHNTKLQLCTATCALSTGRACYSATPTEPARVVYVASTASLAAVSR